MKRFLIIVVVMMILVSVIGFSQVIIPTNQVTVEWDPVAPLDALDIIAYELFRSPWPITGDRQDPGQHESLGVVTNPTDTITFTVEGDFALGVRTIRDFQGVITYSEINWSDQNGTATPDPFVVRYVRNPAEPENFRLQ